MSTKGLARVAQTVRTGLAPAALATALALGSAGTAHAALSTDAIFVAATQSAMCTVVNAGKTTIDVTVDVVEPFDDSVNGPETCSLAPGEICVQEIGPINGLDRFLVCRVAASGGKVRGILANTTSGVSSQAR